MHKSHFQALVEYLLDNVFDLATIVVAAYLVIRHQIRPFAPTDIAELITWVLGVLGLIAVSGLWERNRRLHRIERLSEQNRDIVLRHLSGKARADDFFSLHSLSEKTFESASDILIVGATLRRATREYAHVLGQRLAAGAKIRFILSDPLAESVLNDCSKRFTGDFTPEYWQTTLQTVENVIDATARTPGSKGRIEIGYLPFLPSFGCVMVDPDKPHGLCIVEVYFSQSVEPTPAFLLSSSEDARWFQVFRQQCDVLWKSCRIERLPKKKQAIESEDTVVAS